MPSEIGDEKDRGPSELQQKSGETHRWYTRSFLRRSYWLVAFALGLSAVSAWVWHLRHRDTTPDRLATERQITFTPIEDRVNAGSVSPDGKFVAYHTQTGVYIRSIDSGETHPVKLPDELSKRIFSLGWFPGGDKLVADAATPFGAPIADDSGWPTRFFRPTGSIWPSQRSRMTLTSG